MALGGLLARLFGSGGGEPGELAQTEAVEYKGFRIVPAPFQEGGQYKTAGRIERDVDGQLQSVSFIRADNHDTLESAIGFSVAKAKQIVDEQGESIFDSERL